MKNLAFLFFVVSMVLGVPAGLSAAPVARPTPEQLAWQDMELEMFVCMDPCEWQGREYDNHSTPLAQINPVKLDAEQWCRAARSFGAGQILFVAKHTGGFCWWHTETSKYGIKETPYKSGRGDVLAEVAAACRKHGLKLAVYVYPGDDQWGASMGRGGKTKDPAKQDAYNRVFRQQMTEVLSNYGPISEVWFDGSCVIEVGDILRKHAPQAMVFQGPHATLRWVGNEAGYAPYPAWNSVRKADAGTGIATAAHGTPDGDVWMPLEVDTVLHDHFWFWKADNARSRRSLEKLMDCYYRSVGHGAVLLLNSAPATDGLIPEGDMTLYDVFGKEIQRRFDKSIAESRGEGTAVELDLGRPTPVNHVISMEDIAQGERVRAYRLEGLVGTQWKVLYGEGISIGHKKIDRFPTETLSRVRLVVTRSAETPIIRRLAAYHVDIGPNSPMGSVQDAPAGRWTRLTALEAGALRGEWKTWTIDLTPGIRAPGEFEFEVCGTGGEGRLEVRQVELLIAGQVIEDRVKPVAGSPGRFHIYRMEQTTADSPSIARVTARWVGPKPGPGEARIRPRPQSQ